MVESSAAKAVSPLGFPVDEDGSTLSGIKSKTCQLVDEPSSRVYEHLTQWGILSSIAMHVANTLMARHRWVEEFLV